MKHSLILSALLVMLFSCKKEIKQGQNEPPLITQIKFQLKDSLTEDDFQQLDVNNSVITKFDKNDLTFLRIPFINKSIASDFVLLKIEGNQSFSLGKIIQISRNKDTSLKTTAGNFTFNGKIKIYSLKRNLLTESLTTNGYVDAFHPKRNDALSKAEVVEVPTLPEVVVVGSYPPGDSWSFADWYDLQSIFFGGATGGGGGGGNYGGGNYNSSIPSGGGGGNSGGGPDIPKNSDAIHIDYEPVETLPAIDVNKYIKCFGNIPDQGATCSIKILTDIPNDKDPNDFFDWKNGSPGHTFLQISKSNGNQSVQQNIGFYPTQGWKTILSTAPVPGKFADNADHEFNASLQMNLTPEQLQSTLTYIQYLANFIKYDIDDYNCTDFALDVFNHKRGGNQLAIPMYDIPGGAAPNGTATPQGLYQKLKIMKDQAGTESNNITIPGVKGFAGMSNGPCN